MKKLLATLLAMAITASGYVFVDQEARDRISALEQQNKELVSQIAELQESAVEPEHKVGEVINVKYFYDKSDDLFEDINITVTLENIEHHSEDEWEFYKDGETIYCYKIRYVGTFTEKAYSLLGNYPNDDCELSPTIFIHNNEHLNDSFGNTFVIFNKAQVNNNVNFELSEEFRSNTPITGVLYATGEFFA